MNIETAYKLRQLADFLATKVPADQFTLDTWGHGEITPEHPCGTLGCAMGWATHLFPDWLRLVPGRNLPHLSLSCKQANGEWRPIVGKYTLAEELGITPDEAYSTFFPGTYVTNTPTLVAWRIQALVDKYHPLREVSAV